MQKTHSFFSNLSKCELFSKRVPCSSHAIRLDGFSRQSSTSSVPSSGASASSTGDQGRSAYGFRIQKISKAMKVYLEKAREHQEFMKKESAEFELGKRHLANMMSLDPDTMTQQDIDKAIEYLLPSGLFSPRARPLMKPPEQIHPKHKSVQFGADGRPFHSLFYTMKPNFYQILYDVSVKLENLHKIEDDEYNKGVTEPSEKLILVGTDWISKNDLEARLLEVIKNDEYSQFLAAMENLSVQPYAFKEREFIMNYRNTMGSGFQQTMVMNKAQIEQDESGRQFSKAVGKKKKTWVEVTLWPNGSGIVDVDGKSIGDLPRLQSKETVLFPFILLDRLGEFDVKAKIQNTGGGESAIAAAVRHGISLALCAFLPEKDKEKLRLAGLLTTDPRIGERQKFGQKGPRAKWIWKKR